MAFQYGSNVLVAVLTVLVGAFGLLLEVNILGQILSHPAGGWPATSWLNLAANGTVSALPYVAILLWWVWRGHEQNATRMFRTMLMVAVIGVLFAAVGLSQYGHATPAFLALGFASQWVAVAVGVFASSRSSAEK